ncbi:hypothetical protein GCM10009809_15060 [Isoptericola hypogeus]|uniref:DUF1634 domain-containing protein n=1 Tax=Isoptericola hypogeus TaxID=300179 RepID=A0ABP4VDH1_9MICO
MNDRATRSPGRDEALARRIAVLMRVGTATGTGLLVAGVACLGAGAHRPSAVSLVAGCSVLVLLPLVRLVMMLDDFARRADTRFVVLTAVVIGLVVAGAAVGVAA